MIFIKKTICSCHLVKDFQVHTINLFPKISTNLQKQSHVHRCVTKRGKKLTRQKELNIHLFIYFAIEISSACL